MRGEALAELGRYDEAREAFGRVRGPGSKSTVALFMTNTTIPEMRDLASALDFVEEAVLKRPDLPVLLTTLGVVRYRLGDWAGAIEALDRTVELGTDSVVEWLFMAMARVKLGQSEEARVWYDRAREWIGTHTSEDEKLMRFEAQAREVLGIDE